MSEKYRIIPPVESKERISQMTRTKMSYSEALLALVRKGHYSDRSETHALAKLLTQGVITIEGIGSLDIQ